MWRFALRLQIMPSHEPSRTRPLEPTPAPGETKRTTVIPPGGAEAVRSELPTLVDEAELEAARIASMRHSSTPPVPPAAPSAAEIHVEWAPDSGLDPEEIFSGYVLLLGAFTRVPVLRVPLEELPSLSMDNRLGFLVALIDGASSIQNLLDVAAAISGSSPSATTNPDAYRSTSSLPEHSRGLLEACQQ